MEGLGRSPLGTLPVGPSRGSGAWPPSGPGGPRAGRRRRRGWGGRTGGGGPCVGRRAGAPARAGTSDATPSHARRELDPWRGQGGRAVPRTRDPAAGARDRRGPPARDAPGGAARVGCAARVNPPRKRVEGKPRPVREEEAPGAGRGTPGGRVRGGSRGRMLGSERRPESGRCEGVEAGGGTRGGNHAAASPRDQTGRAGEADTAARRARHVRFQECAPGFRQVSGLDSGSGEQQGPSQSGTEGKSTGRDGLPMAPSMGSNADIGPTGRRRYVRRLPGPAGANPKSRWPAGGIPRDAIPQVDPGMRGRDGGLAS